MVRHGRSTCIIYGAIIPLIALDVPIAALSPSSDISWITRPAVVAVLSILYSSAGSFQFSRTPALASLGTRRTHMGQILGKTGIFQEQTMSWFISSGNKTKIYERAIKN